MQHGGNAAAGMRLENGQTEITAVLVKTRLVQAPKSKECLHNAVIRIYDDAANTIETQEHKTISRLIAMVGHNLEIVLW